MTGGNYARILAVSPRDASLYRNSEQLAMIFGFITFVVGFAFLAMWALGTHKVPVVTMFLIWLPFPVALAICVWLHNRIARKHGLQ